MYKHTLLFILCLFASMATWAQQLNVLPILSAESGAYDDEVNVVCTFPEGCAGGKYWINGGELQAKPYSEPIVIDYDCALSVAGTDAAGRIITDVVTRQYAINRVTPPTVTPSPAEGMRTTSFYVTRLQWSHATSVTMDLAPFKTGGSRNGENVVWLTGPDGSVISGGDANNLWQDGLNAFKAYIYKHYTPEQKGEYVLHIAGGVFVIDGKTYADELQFHYTVADGSPAPVFSPAEGTYKGSVTVTIDYPTDGSAFYKFYKLNGNKAKQYTEPLLITETTSIEAYGMDEDFTTQTPSAVASYTIVPADPTPEVLDAPIITREGNTVSISGPAGATLKYWMGRSMSDASIYTAPFTVDHNGTIYCVAYSTTGISPTTQLVIDGFPEPDRGDKGELVLITPVAQETAHVRGLSPNGRWAVGFIGSDTSAKGFVWDLEADEFQYASTIFINQLWSVLDDGTAYGWRARTTDVDESTTEDDLLWGTFKDGVWTEMPRADFDKAIAPALPAGVTIPADLPAVTAVSANGEWAILGQTHRFNTKTGVAEYLISMNDRFASEGRSEVLTCIANDGTIFGTYDPSLFSSEMGVGMVRTNDGRWRDVAEWLRDEKGLTLLDGYYLSSVRAVTGDGSTLLFHASARGLSSDDTFTRGLMLRIDANVRHQAPVALKAEQMSGRKIVKLSWKAPLGNTQDVTSYTILRNGTTLASVNADTFNYYDDTVEPNVNYVYTVQALYADGTESVASREASITITMDNHLPVRNLDSRPVGLNSLCLTWDAPVTTLPKLQYFGEENESYAFGTGTYNAEFGIRFPASDLATFEGQQIRTFQFLPTGAHKSFTLNLYRGDTGKAIKYEATPFYSQEIDPSTLNYGTVNTIELTTPQDLPLTGDLYVSLLIESSGNDNMLGISYEGFRSGYTDLCRIIGVHDQMVAMSQNSSVTTEVVLPLGLGIASATDFEASIVTGYDVTLDGKPAATTTTTRQLLEQLSEGHHTMSVTAQYRDGVASAPATIDVVMADNPAAYCAVEPRAEMQSDGSVLITWDAPRDDDRSLIHWGDLTPSHGWELARGLTGFMAMSIYPVNMTAYYAEDYEITGMFFCPTAKGVDYEIALGNLDGDIFAYANPTDLTIGEVNYLRFDKPVSVDGITTYQLVVNVPEVEEGVAALAYDSSGKWQSGYSNLLNFGMGLTTLAEFVSIDEHPNWLMGLTLQQKTARPLPVEGYYVTLDDQLQTATPIAETRYATAPLADGPHTARVDVVYKADNLRVDGRAISFTAGVDGIFTPVVAPAAQRTYDLQGRHLVTPVKGQPVIVGGKTRLEE